MAVDAKSRAPVVAPNGSSSISLPPSATLALSPPPVSASKSVTMPRHPILDDHPLPHGPHNAWEPLLYCRYGESYRSRLVDASAWNNVDVLECGGGGRCCWYSVRRGIHSVTAPKKMDEFSICRMLVETLKSDADLAAFLLMYRTRHGVGDTRLEFNSILPTATVADRARVENHLMGYTLDGKYHENRLSHVYQGEQLSLAWLLRHPVFQHNNVRMIIVDPILQGTSYVFKVQKVLTVDDHFMPMFEEENAAGDWNVMQYIMLWNPPGHWQLLGTRRLPEVPNHKLGAAAAAAAAATTEPYVQVLHKFHELPSVVQRALYAPKHSAPCPTSDKDCMTWYKWGSYFSNVCDTSTRLSIEPIWAEGIDRLCVSSTAFSDWPEALACALYYEHGISDLPAARQQSLREKLSGFIHTPDDAWSLVSQQNAWNLVQSEHPFRYWSKPLDRNYRAWQRQVKEDERLKQVSLAQLELATQFVNTVRHMIKEYYPSCRHAQVRNPQAITPAEALGLLRERSLWNTSEQKFQEWKSDMIKQYRRNKDNKDVFCQQVQTRMNRDDSLFDLNSAAAAPFRRRLTIQEFPERIVADLHTLDEAVRLVQDAQSWCFASSNEYSAFIEQALAFPGVSSLVPRFGTENTATRRTGKAAVTLTMATTATTTTTKTMATTATSVSCDVKSQMINIGDSTDRQTHVMRRLQEYVRHEMLYGSRGHFRLSLLGLAHLTNGIARQTRTVAKQRMNLQNISVVLWRMNGVDGKSSPVMQSYDPRDVHILPALLRRFVFLLEEKPNVWRVVAHPGNGNGESKRVFSVDDLPSWLQHQFFTWVQLRETMTPLEHDL